MPVIISIIKARLAFMAITNASIHILALLGKGYAWLDPNTLGATFDAVSYAVVLTTGTVGLALPAVAKALQFVDVPPQEKV